MRRILIVLCVIVGSLGQITAFAGEGLESKDLEKYLDLLNPDTTRKLISGERPKEKIDITTVLNLLEEKKPTKMEDLLAALPESLRSNFLLLYKSGSMQDASFENPRAVLFDYDSNVMMAFNGHPAQDHNND